MATITVNIQDGVAREFREVVKQKMGEHKGVLGKAIEEALRQWIHERRQKQISQEMLELMDEGIDMGGIRIQSRGDLYDRR